MRKAITLVIAITIIPLVEALTLFGEEVSVLILTPSVLILIILIVFISIIIKDKIKSKSLDTDLKLDAAEAPKEDPTEDLTSGLPPIEPPTELPIEKPPLEEIPRTSRLTQQPKIDYLKEIDALEKESSSKNVEEIHKKINELIKRFFSDYLGINYSFTFEELEKELKKGNRKIQCFSDNLSSISYGPEGISKENLIELIGEFKDTVMSSIQENQSPTTEFKKEVEEKKKEIYMLLKKGEKLIKKDKIKAQEEYNKLFELYNPLPDEDKETIRLPILDLYNKFRT